jgi:mono/diheme cytochrome c family protein
MKTTIILVIAFVWLSSFYGMMAQTIRPWVTPNSAVWKVNPFKVNCSSLNETKALYINTCGPCHGEKGKGDGIAAVACNPKPADHTSDAIQKETDGSLFWKISEGRGPMPSYKNMLTADQRWKLICYIRSLKGKK